MAANIFWLAHCAIVIMGSIRLKLQSSDKQQRLVKDKIIKPIIVFHGSAYLQFDTCKSVLDIMFHTFLA